MKVPVYGAAAIGRLFTIATTGNAKTLRTDKRLIELEEKIQDKNGM